MRRILFFYIFVLFFNILILTPNIKTYSHATSSVPKLAIVIDDFGSYEQAGIDTLFSSDCPITCAVIPFVDNTQQNIDLINSNGHEIILHMPMQSHINLPKEWYGPVFISNFDSKETIYQKLSTCLNSFPSINGFNIHIGSGVSQNKNIMKTIYQFAKENNLYFLDSRTIQTKATEDACFETNSVYLGRDVFLEADKNKSYSGVRYRLFEAVKIAKEKGYAIAIGHIGAEGGENTARAIVDSLNEIRAQGVELVYLSDIYNFLKIDNK